MTTIRVQVDPWERIILRWPYDRALVDLIKTVPSSRRRWDDDEKAWLLDSAFDAVTFTETARGLGHTIVGDPRYTDQQSRNEPPGRDRDHAETWADTLLAAVGTARVDDVHRALTRVLHPDLAHGNAELMQQLNTARDRRKVAAQQSGRSGAP